MDETGLGDDMKQLQVRRIPKLQYFRVVRRRNHIDDSKCVGGLHGDTHGWTRLTIVDDSKFLPHPFDR